MHLSDFSSRLDERHSFYDLDADRLYDVFKASYEAQTGAAWEKGKFLSRARNWTFYGSERGFVAVRIQGSGMKKLVGVAGNPVAVLGAFDELVAEGGPIWGAVSDGIAKMAKKRGMIVPHLMMGGPFFIKTLIKMIPPSVFGDHSPVVNADGGITFEMDDVGTVTKYLIGNKEYFATVMKMDQVRDAIGKVPGLSSAIKMMGL